MALPQVHHIQMQILQPWVWPELLSPEVINIAAYITNCSGANNVTSNVVTLTVDAPSAPAIGTITQPTSCASPTGSVVLNGLPATGTWTINPGAITGTGTSTTISNLIAGYL